MIRSQFSRSKAGTSHGRGISISGVVTKSSDDLTDIAVSDRTWKIHNHTYDQSKAAAGTAYAWPTLSDAAVRFSRPSCTLLTFAWDNSGI